MTTLANFPMKDQRTEKTADGNPPENGSYDCVPTSLAAAIQYFDGGYVSGDELKDAEYGQAYRNAGTSLRRFVDDATDRARAKYHVAAEAYNSTDPRNLTAQIHAWVKQGFPVIATIPSAWATAHTPAELVASRFSTHVIVFYEEGSGYLAAMNPWGGFRHEGNDAYWQGRLCDGQVWKIYKETAPVATALPYTNNNGLLTYKSGHIGAGFSKWVLDNKYTADLVTAGEGKVGDATYCVFSDMRTLYWSSASGVVDMGKSGTLVLALANAQQTVVQQVPVVPPTVVTALAAAANVLHPYADVLNQVLAAQKGLN